MSENYSSTEILQFYLDNDLNEIISENPQNYFLKKDISKKTVKKETKAVIADIKPEIIQHFVKPQSSTNESLSSLAKKSQEAPISNEKFISLNEIVARAKTAADAAKTLSELRKAVEDFDGCNLKKMATNTVFADGNPDAKLMIIGEAPGNNEDLQGTPFCDDSGKLLNEMFGAINMTREENLYLTNIIFWRPPGNRRPTEEELAICRPFIERHIQILNPEILVLVGATAMAAINGIHEPISKVRGKLMDFSPEFLSRTIKTFTIFHPSYLMRQPSKKKIAWQDMLALESFLNDTQKQ